MTTSIDPVLSQALKLLHSDDPNSAEQLHSLFVSTVKSFQQHQQQQAQPGPLQHRPSLGVQPGGAGVKPLSRPQPTMTQAQIPTATSAMASPIPIKKAEDTPSTQGPSEETLSGTFSREDTKVGSESKGRGAPNKEQRRIDAAAKRRKRDPDFIVPDSESEDEDEEENDDEEGKEEQEDDDNRGEEPEITSRSRRKRDLDFESESSEEEEEEEEEEGEDENSGDEDEDEKRSCEVCEGTSSEKSNELLVCSSCSRRFHQKCHRPPIPDHNVQAIKSNWLCYNCTATKNSTVTAQTTARRPRIPEASSKGTLKKLKQRLARKGLF